MENIKIHTPFLVFRYRLVNLQSGIFAFRRKEIITMWENYPSCRDRHRGKRWKVYEKFNIDHLADYKGHCSCDSPSFVRASRTASARFCFMSCIVIHLHSSLHYTLKRMNCIAIQL